MIVLNAPFSRRHMTWLMGRAGLVQVEHVDIKRLPDGTSRGFAFIKRQTQIMALLISTSITTLFVSAADNLAEELACHGSRKE